MRLKDLIQSDSGQLVTTLATGTAPLAVSSTTKVANLNVDRIDNLDSTAFLRTLYKNSFYGMAIPGGSDTAWIRTTTQGILPYQSGTIQGGHSSIGTWDWSFGDVWSQRIQANWVHVNRNGLGHDGGLTLWSADSNYIIALRNNLGTLVNTNNTQGITEGWAMYFTMSDTVNRGWIFRRGSTNVAGITGNGTYLSSVTSATHLEGNQGKVIIDSTAPGTYSMLFRQKSINGVFTGGVYQQNWELHYTDDAIISSNTNDVSHSIQLINELGITKLERLFIANTKITGPTAQDNMAGYSLYSNGNMGLSGTMYLHPTLGNYREGIRIYPYANWSDIVLLGMDTPGTSGITANSWFIGNNNGNFYITRAAAESPHSTAQLACVANKWRVTGKTIFKNNVALESNLPDLSLRDLTTADEAYAIIRFGNKNTINGAFIFLNGPTRVNDGGPNLLTIKNDLGDVRLAANNVIVTGNLTCNNALTTQHLTCNNVAYLAGGFRSNSTLTLGDTGFKFYWSTTTVTSGVTTAEVNPTEGGWYGHLRMMLWDTRGYYTDLAFGLDRHEFYLRRVWAGNDNGWVRFWNSSNLGPASASANGYITTEAQTFAGLKTFNSSITFAGNAGGATISTPTALSYGRLQGYGSLCINGDTDNSGNERVLITSGHGMSDSLEDGLAIGSNSCVWRNTTELASNGDIIFYNSGTSIRQMQGQVGDNDFWRIAGGATAANAGWMEIATADDGNEPIYVRQYTGIFNSIARTLTLLDGAGNTSFPGAVTMPSLTCNISAYLKMGFWSDTTLTYGNNGLQFYWVSGGAPTSGAATAAVNPDGNYYGHLRLGHWDASGWYIDLAFGLNNDNFCMRRVNSGTEQSWTKFWSNKNMGSGSGLNADMLDGYHVTGLFSSFSVTGGTTSGPIVNATIGNTTRTVTLPAASRTASGIVTTGAQTFAGVKQFYNGIWLKSNNAYDGNVKINFGDGDYVYLREPWDDGLEIKSRNVISMIASNVYIGGTAGTRPSTSRKLYVNGTIEGTQIYGAVWNDYAEYRRAKNQERIEPGRTVVENGDDTISISNRRLAPGGMIVSDTFGFAIGQIEHICETPIAVSGRVLAYPYEARTSYKPGDAVCTGPNGTVSKMTREEIQEYPERIIGIVSCVPDYETWGANETQVNGRIWIKVR